MPNVSPNTLEVFIRTKSRVIYQGTASTVSSVNDTGPFDILLQHANFICIVKDLIIIDKGLSTRKDLRIDRGVLKAINNKIDGYIGI